MNRSLLAAPAAALLLCGLLAGTALAQEDVPSGPGTVACQEANGLVIDLRAQLKTANDDLGTKSGELADAELNLGRAIDSAKPYFQNLVDTLTPVVATLKTTVGDLEAKVTAAAAAADEACALAEPPQAPTATEAPTATAEATTTPAEQPAPTTAPADDIDCADVTSAEAAAVLARDLSDPNHLDADHDGLACEVDEGASTDGPSDSVAAGSGAADAVPSGAVDTGYAG